MASLPLYNCFTHRWNTSLTTMISAAVNQPLLKACNAILTQKYILKKVFFWKILSMLERCGRPAHRSIKNQEIDEIKIKDSCKLHIIVDLVINHWLFEIKLIACDELIRQLSKVTRTCTEKWGFMRCKKSWGVVS